MTVSPISNQVKQSVPTISASSSTSTSTTPVTSNNPTVLTQQEKTVQNEILQLQQSHGSSKNIQNLNQELQTIQKQLQRVSATATPAVDTQVVTPKSSSMDIKA
jgi:hypothetical protein